MDDRDARSLARYRFPAINVYAGDKDHNEHVWQPHMGGPNGRHEIKKYIPLETHPKILNLGANWYEAKVYQELGYNCTHLVMSTQVQELLTAEGFTCLMNDMCEMLDIENESFDGIISVQALEHVWYPWKALLEMYRVLRNGGRMVLNVPQWHGKDVNVDIPDNAMVNLQHVSCLHTHQMRFMVRTAGFKLLHQDIPDTCVQTLFCEKMSYEDLVNYPADGPLHNYYDAAHANFLRDYCAI